MTFEREPAHGAAAAGPGDSVRTHLDEAAARGGGGGGGEPDLAVTPSVKRAAAQYIQNELGPAVARKSGQAVTASTDVFGSSNTTPGALRGWDTRKGLNFCLERWGEAWQNVRNHLQSELNALDATGLSFQGLEVDTAHGLGATPTEEHGLLRPSTSRINEL